MTTQILVFDEDDNIIGTLESEHDNMYDHTRMVSEEFGNDWYSCEVIVKGYNPDKTIN